MYIWPEEFIVISYNIYFMQVCQLMLEKSI